MSGKCNCWWCNDQGDRRHRVDVPIDFGWTESPRRKPSKKKTRGQPKGCPGNDGNAHVYVWVPETWYPRWEHRVCCGCEKRGRGYRLTRP